MYTDKLFTGQREMAGLGIYHYGARFYSPKLGRFLSADSIVPGIANPQNLNRFSYVGNNPVRYTDPTGYCRIDAVPEDCLKADKSNAPKKPTLPGGGGGGNNNNNRGGGGRGGNTDTDGDSVPNLPDPSYPPTTGVRTVQEDCIPGNLVECFYNQGLMPSGDYNITSEEYLNLRLAINYDIDNQGPIINYNNRRWYDTPFFNGFSLTSTICINGVQCRGRSEYNYIAQGAWSAAALEGKDEMLAVIVGWKLVEYDSGLPSFNTLASANDGYDFYLATNPANYLYSIYGPDNSLSALFAFTEYVIIPEINSWLP